MERYRAIFSHLLHQPAAQSTAAGKVFVTKPTDEVERRWGRVFGLLTLEPNERASLDLLEFIAEAIKTAYYAPTQNPTGATGGRLQARFEAALRQANHVIAQRLEENEASPVDLTTLEGVVGVALGPVVLLSTVGPAAAFVVHARRRNEYITSEITADRHRTGEPNPLHLFTQSMQGQLGSADYLFCCTQNVLDYISLERVKRAVTQFPLPTAARTIRDALAPAREPGTFIGILVGLLPQVTNVPAAAPTTVAEAAQRDSMRQLSRSQERTDQLLMPKLLPRLLRSAQVAGRALSNAASAAGKLAKDRLHPEATPPAPVVVADEVQPIRQADLGLVGKTINLLRAIGVIVMAMLRRMWASAPIAAIRRVVRHRLYATWRWYRRQTPRQRLFTAGIFVVLVLLVVNIGWRVIGRSQTQRTEQATQLLAQARTLVDSANASVIYGDESAARKSLQEAQAAVQQAQRLNVMSNEVSTVSQTVEAALAALRQTHTVAEPTLINNFTNLDSGADISAAILEAGGVLVAQNRRNGSLYPLTLETHVLGAPTAPDAALEPFAHLAAGDGGAVVVSQSGQLLRLRLPRLAVEPMSIEFSANAVPVATATYQNRLYVLTPAANQVWRLDRFGSGFGVPAGWVQDDTVHLDQAVDLVVDGDVYILSADGRITKLTRGASVPLTQETIDPPIKTATKIKLVGGRLYVLDPTERRVVVWGKDGHFETQYQMPLLEALKDFTVLEAEKKIYLLSASSIYGIPMR